MVCCKTSKIFLQKGSCALMPLLRANSGEVDSCTYLVLHVLSNVHAILVHEQFHAKACSCKSIFFEGKEYLMTSFANSLPVSWSGTRVPIGSGELDLRLQRSLRCVSLLRAVWVCSIIAGGSWPLNLASQAEFDIATKPTCCRFQQLEQ